jgi:regulator of protease activity HflC (stomatin/prohibitin superfamily)
MIRERERTAISGWAVVPVLLAAAAVAVYGLVNAVTRMNRTDGFDWWFPVWTVALVFVGFCGRGFFVVNPGEGKVLQLFGSYAGTARLAGLRWDNPLFLRTRISMRVRNFESQRLKVNDHEGNPIEIAAVVVWRVVDSAEAIFEVDNFENYVHVQSEAAVRNLASSYTYDSHDDASVSLRSHTAVVADHLKREIQDRLSKAGVEVIEARISHLAYAPEIAAAMLQRQQAGAIIAARQRIVEGAVGMVEMALEMLSRREIVQLDDERKASMVSNLLVVLCGERSTQPVINAGTIYQ